MLADVVFFFARSGSEKNALWSMAAPVWYGSVMAALGQFYVLCQFYVSSMSVLCQFYGSVMAALGQFYGSAIRLVLCQFYVRGSATRVAPVWGSGRRRSYDRP